jgi:hypothetical protein
MIELTLEQRRAVATDAESPPRVIDPSTHTKYVLVREELYDRVRQVFDADEESQFVREMAPHAMEVFGRDGWDDPAMDVYNELDPRIQP